MTETAHPVLNLAEEIRMLSGRGGSQALSLEKNPRFRPEDECFLIKGS